MVLLVFISGAVKVPWSTEMKHRKTSAARAGVPMALLQFTKRETQRLPETAWDCLATLSDGPGTRTVSLSALWLDQP